MRRNLGALGVDKYIHGTKSIVTEWDYRAQAEIAEELSKFNSTIGVHGEEGNLDTDAERYWTIDPIDGTLHFSRGNGERCHSAVALMERQICQQCPDQHAISVPVVSAIYNFASNNLFTATATSVSRQLTYRTDAWRDEEILSVGSSTNLIEIYTNTTPESYDLELEAERQLGTYALRHAAASYSLINIAAGNLDALIVADNPFTGQQDIAPGALLVVGAGGEAHTVGRSCFSALDPKSRFGIGNTIISNGATKASVFDRVVFAAFERGQQA